MEILNVLAAVYVRTSRADQDPRFIGFCYPNKNTTAFVWSILLCIFDDWMRGAYIESIF